MDSLKRITTAWTVLVFVSVINIAFANSPLWCNCITDQGGSLPLREYCTVDDCNNSKCYLLSQAISRCQSQFTDKIVNVEGNACCYVQNPFGPPGSCDWVGCQNAKHR